MKKAIVIINLLNLISYLAAKDLICCGETG
jgi:hypothetical protein